MISEPCLEQTVHLSCTNTNTISKRTETRFHLSLIIGCVQNDFWAYVTFVTNRPHILHKYEHYIQMDRNEIPLEPRHLGVLWCAVKMISEPCLQQTVHLSCTNANTISKRMKTRSTWALSPRSSIGCVQNDFRDQGTFGAKLAIILRQD